MTGLVLKSTGSWYSVSDVPGVIYPCRIKGVFKLKESVATNPVAVGDRVDFSLQDDGTGQITAIHDRKNYIIRKATRLSRQSQIIAANIDRAFLIVTLGMPRTSSGFMDRFLATCEAYSIPATVVFNKRDLYDDEMRAEERERTSIYSSLGYPCIGISAVTGENLGILNEALGKGINLFAGHSGTGKSTLINRLHPPLNLKTAAISSRHLKGMHTTTFAEAHPLPGGGYIIDTPGIREFGLYEFEQWEISHYFPEMRALLGKCKFANCLHVNEPGCEVQKQLTEGKIHPRRYESYLSILSGEDCFN